MIENSGNYNYHDMAKKNSFRVRSNDRRSRLGSNNYSEDVNLEENLYIIFKKYNKTEEEMVFLFF